MGADAIVLFRIGTADVEDPGGVIIYRGSDYVGVFSGTRFHDVRENPAAISVGLSLEFPEWYEAHRDPRGIFAFPDTVEIATLPYETLVSDPDLRAVGMWLPHHEPAKSETPARKSPLFRVRPMAGARDLTQREVAPTVAALALGDRRFKPTRARQRTFRVREDSSAVVAFYRQELDGLDVSLERLELPDQTVVQLIGRSPSARVVVKIDSGQGEEVLVSVTVMSSV